MARRTTLRTPLRIALAVLGSSLGRALADGLDRAPILPKAYSAPAPLSQPADDFPMLAAPDPAPSPLELEPQRPPSSK